MYKVGKGTHNFLVFCTGYVVILIAAVIAYFVLTPFVGLSVSLLGCLGWMLFTGLWIVFVDSRKRWSGVGAGNRLVRLFTFYRG